MNKFKKLLSRLTLSKIKKILGPKTQQLLAEGGKYEIEIDNHVKFNNENFTVSTNEFTVNISYDESCRLKLKIDSSTGNIVCPEVGAVFSLILEEKMVLGLATPPKKRVPIESLTEKELIAQAIEERSERANSENIKITSTDADNPWTDYVVTNHSSGKSYKVALRGFEKGVSYCSCPDFKNNTLGTCKHVIAVEKHVRTKFTKKTLSKPYERGRSSLSVDYSDNTPKFRFHPGKNLLPEVKKIMDPYIGCEITDNFQSLAIALEAVKDFDTPIHIHPDAEKLLDKKLFMERISRTMNEIRKNPAEHPLRKTLLKTELRPYQLDGIAFAVSKGRAILADDMGLGKTIQGIGIAEILAREARIKKVLVICPTSLKSQWCNEVVKFSDRTATQILGSAEERAEQYDNSQFFTVCNYEQVLRDTDSIESVKWDLIILDEGQRIKNWETLTSRVIKSLQSQFALVLSGTPLENRLEELYNVASFVDHHRLGPAFRFLNTHRVVDEKGKVLGYKNLDKLRKKLEPILLRRTRALVLKELPERNNKIVRVIPHEEQSAIDVSNRKIISQIISKPYINEMDLLRLQKSLLLCRMAADSTYLVDKQEPYYSTKLEALKELIEDLLTENDRKIVLFSEWTTMLNLIERDAIPAGIEFVRLDGSIPQKKRGGLVNKFQSDPECRLFITTNAGSTGLNLQAANTVINVDLPWNPAVLEQRIARAHRMGQKRPVNVYIMVSEGTLEEKILGLLGAKQELATAAVNIDSNIVEVSMQSGIEELKRRMEMLIGGPEDKELDKSMQNNVQEQIEKDRQQQLSEAGGKLLSAAFEFLGAAFNNEARPEEDPVADSIFKEFANSSEKAEDGKYNLNISLDETALKNLAGTLSAIMLKPKKEK